MVKNTGGNKTKRGARKHSFAPQNKKIRFRDEEEAIRRAGEYRRKAKDRMRDRRRDIPRLRNEEATVQEVVKRVRARLAQMAHANKK